MSWSIGFEDGGESWRIFEPTRDPAEAMRLLEKHKFGLSWWGDGWICGPMGQPASTWGHQHPTPCIAICKAVVALARGEGRA